MANPREDDIFKVVHRVFFILNLSGSQSDSDVFQELVNQKADAELKTHCK